MSSTLGLQWAVTEIKEASGKEKATECTVEKSETECSVMNTHGMYLR